MVRNIGQLRRLLFVFLLMGLTVLFLIPTAYLPQESLFNWWDKLQHILAFGVLSVGAYWAYPHHYQRAFLGLGVYGALIEILQSVSTWRQGDALDWVADSIGIACIWLLVALIHKVHRTRQDHKEYKDHHDHHDHHDHQDHKDHKDHKDLKVPLTQTSQRL